MKAKLKFLGFIVLALSLIFLMAACDDGSTTMNTPDVPGSGGGGGSGGGSGSGKTSTGNRLIVMDPAMVASNLESMSPDGTLVFANLEEKDLPVKGDIICSAPSKAAPYGFLYKVKTVTTKDGEIVVATEMATLEEAVEEAEVKQSIELVFAESEEIDGVEVVRMAAYTDSPQRAVSLFKNPVKLNINKTVIPGVIIKGSIELNAAVDCDIKISWFTMQRFELSISPKLKADLTAAIGVGLKKEETFTIYKQRFSPITIWVGPVPVVFVPEISINCVITAEGEVVLASVNLAKWDYSYAFGVRYEDGNLGPFKKNASQPAKYLEDLQLDQITLNGEVKIKPKVGFMFGLYDMAWVGISGGFYGKLSGEAGVSYSNKAANAKLSLSCGLEFDVDAKLEILGEKIGKPLSKTFYTIDWPIWEKTWSTTSAVTGVSLNKNSLSLNAGASETLIATITPTNATNKAVSWSRSNTAVATVSENGTVTAVAPGSATITVTTSDGGKTATCTVTVNSIAVTGVSLNKSSISLGVSGAETLVAAITPTNATNKAVSWSSSNTSIATVSENGVVIGVGAGMANITVMTEDGNKTATCSVTVTGNSGDQIFTSWDAFAAWLATQPNNTKSNPYSAKLNLSNLPGSIKSTLGNKYVSLDFSGSTFTSIGYGAFSGCTSLASVTIPNGVTGIGNWAFEGCTSLVGITIPSSVTSIGQLAFFNCTSLAGVTIPNSVTSIGNSAFAQCTSLTSVKFEGTITSANFSTSDPFPGDLRTKYLAGGIGTYTRPSGGTTWTKQ